MAQKGRGGPRTQYQRLCPGTFPPFWPWQYLKLVGEYSPAGPFDLLPIIDPTWAEIEVTPSTGLIYWEGGGTWNGDPITWEMFHLLATPLPGVYLDFLLTQGAGYFYQAFYYDLGITWEPSNFGPFLLPYAFDYAAPFTPFGRTEVKGRQWHEMAEA